MVAASRVRQCQRATVVRKGGASHREIADALIAQRRVHAGWRDPRDHLRDRIRRAVSRGRAS
ncbi:DUF2285 domain-containing protein [Mesorhizobium sp. M0984]